MSIETDSFQPAVEILKTLHNKDVEDFARLLPQLTSQPDTNPKIIAEKLQAAIQSETTAVMVIRDELGRIQASATGSICFIPTGTKAWIDNVVTDREHRGKGYGALLMGSLHAWFMERDVNSVNLTSDPQRLPAGRLYERLGYKERATRVYRRAFGTTAVKQS